MKLKKLNYKVAIVLLPIITSASVLSLTFMPTTSNTSNTNTSVQNTQTKTSSVVKDTAPITKDDNFIDPYGINVNTLPDTMTYNAKIYDHNSYSDSSNINDKMVDVNNNTVLSKITMNLNGFSLGDSSSLHNVLNNVSFKIDNDKYESLTNKNYDNNLSSNVFLNKDGYDLDFSTEKRNGYDIYAGDWDDHYNENNVYNDDFKYTMESGNSISCGLGTKGEKKATKLVEDWNKEEPLCKAWIQRTSTPAGTDFYAHRHDVGIAHNSVNIYGMDDNDIHGDNNLRKNNQYINQQAIDSHILITDQSNFDLNKLIMVDQDKSKHYEKSDILTLMPNDSYIQSIAMSSENLAMRQNLINKYKDGLEGVTSLDLNALIEAIDQGKIVDLNSPVSAEMGYSIINVDKENTLNYWLTMAKQSNITINLNDVKPLDWKVNADNQELVNNDVFLWYKLRSLLSNFEIAVSYTVPASQGIPTVRTYSWKDLADNEAIIKNLFGQGDGNSGITITDMSLNMTSEKKEDGSLPTRNIFGSKTNRDGKNIGIQIGLYDETQGVYSPKWDDNNTIYDFNPAIHYADWISFETIDYNEKTFGEIFGDDYNKTPFAMAKYGMFKIIEPTEVLNNFDNLQQYSFIAHDGISQEYNQLDGTIKVTVTFKAIGDEQPQVVQHVFSSFGKNAKTDQAKTDINIQTLSLSSKKPSTITQEDILSNLVEYSNFNIGNDNVIAKTNLTKEQFATQIQNTTLNPFDDVGELKGSIKITKDSTLETKSNSTLLSGSDDSQILKFNLSGFNVDEQTDQAKTDVDVSALDFASKKPSEVTREDILNNLVEYSDFNINNVNVVVKTNLTKEEFKTQVDTISLNPNDDTGELKGCINMKQKDSLENKSILMDANGITRAKSINFNLSGFTIMDIVNTLPWLIPTIVCSVIAGLVITVAAIWYIIRRNKFKQLIADDEE